MELFLLYRSKINILGVGQEMSPLFWAQEHDGAIPSIQINLTFGLGTIIIFKPRRYMYSKKCSKCGEVKDVKNFSKCSRHKDGLQVWCKGCVHVRDQEKYKDPVIKQRYIEVNRKRQEYCKKKLFEFVQTQKCVDCGETDPIVLEFDHRNPADKFDNVSDLIRRGTWKRVQKEIDKCDMVCANCHRRRTAKQFGYYKYCNA